MSAWAGAAAAWLVLVVAAAWLQRAARRRRAWASAGQAVGALMRGTAGRVVVLAAWLWLGIHFLAR